MMMKKRRAWSARSHATPFITAARVTAASVLSAIVTTASVMAARITAASVSSAIVTTANVMAARVTAASVSSAIVTTASVMAISVLRPAVRRQERGGIPAAIVIGAVVILSTFLSGTAVFAQSSASYDMSAHVVNAGGNPAQGMVLSSGSYLLSLDAVGEGLAGPFLGSPSYSMGVGFVAPYPPPGEVPGLRLLGDKRTLVWSPEPSIGHYDVYRDLITQLPGSYGQCRASRVAAESLVDPDLPPALPAGGGFFYLVTASNLLDEEGTKGFDSHHVPRPNPAPCP